MSSKRKGTLPTWWLATIWTILLFKTWFKITPSKGKVRPTTKKMKGTF